MTSLFLITARGGSKGLPGKNIKMLGQKSLIEYTIDVAKELSPVSDICLSSDDKQIILVAERAGLEIPFVRPSSLATDTASSRDVILHALAFYESLNKTYDRVVLLQPTSPFRKTKHIKEMMNIFHPDLDMVVSVKESHYNPYFSLFEEDVNGYLSLSKPGNFTRRQDCPSVYAYNGSVYVINTRSIREKKFNEFSRAKKFVMDDIHSVDIDSQFDWGVAEMILEKKLWSGSK